MSPRSCSCAGRASAVLVLAFGLLAAVPLLAGRGFLITRGGGDSPFLLLRLHQLLAALLAGEFPTRWMPDAAYGYGFPFFSYYASLPYYLAALLKLYGFSYVAALKLTQLAALLVAAIGAYGWARALPLGADGTGLTRPQAVLVAAAYTFAPFHLVNLYVRGDSLSELWAMALFPLLLLAAQRCLQRPTFGRALALAALTAALAFTHNVSALIFMPFVGLYVLVLGMAARRLPTADHTLLYSLAPTVLALVWGLALAAFFWLPALLETRAVQIGGVSGGYFDYANHFRGRDLVQPSILFDYDGGSPASSPFTMGLAQALAAAGGLVGWLIGAVHARPPARRWLPGASFVLLALALSTWMITPASAFLWERLPLLRLTQFPWRFLSIQALFVAVATAGLLPAIWHTPLPAAAEPQPRALHWVIAVALGLALAIFGLGRLRPDFIPLADADVTAQRLQLLEVFSANIGSTIGFEYLPAAVQPRPYTGETVLGREPQLKALAGTAAGARQWKRGASEQWQVTAADGPATVAVPTYWWPGWTARVDGVPAPTHAAASLGWITVDVPAGAHTLTLRLGRTPLRATAESLSLAALLVPLLAFGLVRYGFVATNFANGTNDTNRADGVRPFARFVRFVARRLGIANGPATAGLAGRRLAFIAGVLLAGAIGLRLAPRPVLPDDLPLSMDFLQLTYPHRDVVRFAAAELRSLSYASSAVARGHALQVQSTWVVSAPATVTLRLESAANLLSPEPIVLNEASHTFAPSAVPQTLASALPVPPAVPPGVYFVTVRVSAAKGELPALTPAGRARGLVHLAPVWVDGGEVPTAAGEPAARFGPAVELLQVDAAQQVLPAGGPQGPASTLDVQVLWRAPQAVPENYPVALRLHDAAGSEWAAGDAQAGYGFYPTPLWRAGEVVPDLFRLPLPPGTPPGTYRLSLSVYDPASLAPLGLAETGVTLTATTPIGARAAQYTLVQGLALSSVDFARQVSQGDALEVSAGWLASSAPAQAYRAQWSLAPTSGGEAVLWPMELAPGSDPRRWPAGSYVLGRARLETPPTLAPGRYSLALALLDEAGASASQPLPLGEVEVVGRPRLFAVPALATPLAATFGPDLKLWGYTAERAAQNSGSGELRLTLAWGAIGAPPADYKYFVHLFNPADDAIVQQVDAMPHAFTYPTSLWAAGEVVTDTVALPLSGLPAGAYRVALGWYDPAAPGLDRLPAFDGSGNRLAGDRLVLPLEVTLP